MTASNSGRHFKFFGVRLNCSASFNIHALVNRRARSKFSTSRSFDLATSWFIIEGNQCERFYQNVKKICITEEWLVSSWRRFCGGQSLFEKLEVTSKISRN
jgi:hypothetical protein